MVKGRILLFNMCLCCYDKYFDMEEVHDNVQISHEARLQGTTKSDARFSRGKKIIISKIVFSLVELNENFVSN